MYVYACFDLDTAALGQSVDDLRQRLICEPSVPKLSAQT